MLNNGIKKWTQPLISKVQYCLLEMIVSAIAFLATDDCDV